MPYLRYTSPSRGVQYFSLDRDIMTVGRSAECDITLEDNVCSRKHCQVRRWAGKFVIEDLQSKNGTFVNGNKVTTHTLSDGDQIAVGDASLVFKLQK